jgi:four helix bundle protein
MGYKFENLEVWQLAVAYVDEMYALTEYLPQSEKYNLSSQLRRAATSIALNIAEGSTSQSDAEQARFLGLSIRSLIETVACQHLIHRRDYLQDASPLRDAYRSSRELFIKLQALRKYLRGGAKTREPAVDYETDELTPF